ncbi:MAG: ABC transporter ATP-binding protein [Anaerolineales bacterium]|nr:ABC transporter ATP-binding protein [Anaerolineales bacterium]
MASIAPLQPYDLQQHIADNRLLGLWGLMSGYRMTYLGATISQALAALAKTSTYLLLRYIIDNVIGFPEAARLLPLFALGFISLAVVEGFFTFTSGRLAARTAEGIAIRLRDFLFDHIQRLPFTYHDKTRTGELIQRSTSDVDAMRRFFSEQAIGVGRILLLFAINFIAILNLNWQLALYSVVAIPLVVYTSYLFFKRIIVAYEKYQEQEAVLSTNLQENLTGVRVVKAFARQSFESEKFDRQNWEKFLRGKQLLVMHSFFWPVTDILCGFQMLAGFLIGALMAINGTITVGTYLAYVGLIVWLIWPMRNLGRFIVQTSTGLVSYQRVMAVIKEEREPLSEADFQATKSIRGEIEFNNLSFDYEAKSKVLSDISFKCKPGQVVALLGSTGSGKTSLVNLLPRFYEYTSGNITIDGVELNKYSRKFLRSQIGIVEQEPFLFSRTIRENITYGIGREATQHEIEQAAQAAAIHDVILTFPNGYDTLVGEKGVTLSGGQKQRVSIARTLLKDPRILILDDATSSVDMETEAEIRRALERLMKGRTSFIIAHRIQSVMNADLILVLDQGRIVQQGTHNELLQEEGIYREVFELQTRIEVELQQEIESSHISGFKGSNQ